MLILVNTARMPTGSFQTFLYTPGWKESPFKEGNSHNLQKLLLNTLFNFPFSLFLQGQINSDNGLGL